MTGEQRPDEIIQRNFHPNFKEVESSRPDWREEAKPSFTKTRKPDWKLGSGANDDGASLEKNHVEIDPYEEGRSPGLNYKLLISVVVPRPIGFLSTRSKDGRSTNLSPFSYFQLINSEPPLFIISFASSLEKPKDSLRNLVESREGVINIASDHFIEALNSTSINAPYGVSEFGVSGLHPADARHVQAPRVKEAVFSIEAKLVEIREYKSKLSPLRTSCVMAVVEGVNFWAREDAIDEQRSMVDPSVLRPVARLGGISYGRLTDLIEIPRPEWEKLSAEEKAQFSHPN
ncbi:hypothetical protein V8E54_011092 [Elaphomyces granulatus]|jgi:flavin reductase (DIM6/NTAB) family NADH-FMN oxidoreductase RutF